MLTEMIELFCFNEDGLFIKMDEIEGIPQTKRIELHWTVRDPNLVKYITDEYFLPLIQKASRKERNGELNHDGEQDLYQGASCHIHIHVSLFSLLDAGYVILQNFGRLKFCRTHVIVHFSPGLLCDTNKRELEMLEQKLSIAIRFGKISVTSQNVVTNRSILAYLERLDRLGIRIVSHLVDGQRFTSIYLPALRLLSSFGARTHFLGRFVIGSLITFIIFQMQKITLLENGDSFRFYCCLLSVLLLDTY
jgi:hypothetical protein